MSLTRYKNGADRITKHKPFLPVNSPKRGDGPRRGQGERGAAGGGAPRAGQVPGGAGGGRAGGGGRGGQAQLQQPADAAAGDHAKSTRGMVIYLYLNVFF